MLGWAQRRSQDFCLGGGHQVHFPVHLSGGGGGVVAEILRDLVYRIRFGGVVAEILRDLVYRITFSGGGGGGVVTEIFHVNKSIALPRFRHSRKFRDNSQVCLHIQTT